MSSLMFSRNFLDLKVFIFFLFLLLCTSIAVPSGEEEKIVRLQKVGVITEGFSSEERNFFLKITGLCCDQNGNLFVADSGFNRIFKFDMHGKYIASFGRSGQGPGEFLGSQRGRNIRISYGNDGKIYIMDPGNRRLSIFSIDGIFLNQLPIPDFPYDQATVNSAGEIYLLSKSGIKLIDCYDSNLQYKTSLINVESHLQFPYSKPSSLAGLRIPNDHVVLKLITKNDDLIIISNFSLRVFVFDKDNKKICEFKVEEEGFVKDIKKDLKKLKEEEKRQRDKLESNQEKDAFFMFVLPFKAFLDSKDNICLVYRNSDAIFEIYKYKLNGIFLGKLRFSEEIDGKYFCSSRSGKIFSSHNLKSQIGIYE